VPITTTKLDCRSRCPFFAFFAKSGIDRPRVSLERESMPPERLHFPNKPYDGLDPGAASGNVRHQVGGLHVECMGEADNGVEACGLVAILNDGDVVPATTSEFR
jgi:hypothetical protein